LRADPAAECRACKAKAACQTGVASIRQALCGQRKELPVIPAPSFSLTRVTDLAALALRWRAFEATADVSFFQSWSWVGCLAAERYSTPMLFCAQIGGRDVALALLNHRPTRLAANTLLLNETGDRPFDAMFVEHNGVLCARGHENLRAACLGFLLRPGLWPALTSRLVLSGVSDAERAAAAQVDAQLRTTNSEPAPFVDLRSLPTGTDGYLASLSANARYQLRRSNRRYAECGAVQIDCADTPDAAMAMLDALGVLHQATWTARGKPGVFANPVFRRFHQALITQALPRGEIAMLRLRAGDQLIGYLYNFRHRGQMLSYQSGLVYPPGDSHRKPGLTAHHHAIEWARAEGLQRYDFLAGPDRYKASLANAVQILHWLDLVPRWSPRGVAITTRRALAGFTGRAA